MKKEKFLIRILMSCIGLIVLGIGVSFTIVSNLGVDPASTLELGMSKQLGISYGTSAAIYNVVILFFVFLIDRKYINISSILAIFLIGYTVEYILMIIQPLNLTNLNFITRIIFCIIGCFIVSIGVTIYIFSNLGVGATDCISEIISERTSFSYRFIRIVSDFILVFLGYLTGGIVGVGTLITAFTIGPFVQLSRKLLYPMLSKILGKKNVEQIDDKNFRNEVVV